MSTNNKNTQNNNTTKTIVNYGRFEAIDMSSDEEEEDQGSAATTTVPTEAKTAAVVEPTEDELAAEGFEPVRKAKNRKPVIHSSVYLPIPEQRIRERFFLKPGDRSLLRCLQDTFPSTTFQIVGRKDAFRKEGGTQTLCITSTNADELVSAQEAAEEILTNTKLDAPRPERTRPERTRPELPKQTFYYRVQQKNYVLGRNMITIMALQKNGKRFPGESNIAIRVGDAETGKTKNAEGTLVDADWEVYPVTLTAYNFPDEPAARAALKTISKEVRTAAANKTKQAAEAEANAEAQRNAAALNRLAVRTRKMSKPRVRTRFKKNGIMTAEEYEALKLKRDQLQEAVATAQIATESAAAAVVGAVAEAVETSAW